MDIRTPKERERDERNSKIRGDYARLHNEYPTASAYRLFTIIGKQYRLSWQSVRKVVLNIK